MLLADVLCAASGSKFDRMLLGNLTNIAEAIKGARRFALTAEANGFVGQTAKKPAQSRLLLDILRNPLLPATWIEWRSQSRYTDDGDDRYMSVDRVGALLRFVDANILECTVAWSHRDSGKPPNVCPFAAFIDCGEKPTLKSTIALTLRNPEFLQAVCEFTPEIKGHGAEELARRFTSLPEKAAVKAALAKHHARRGDSDVDAAIDFESRTVLVPSSLTADFMMAAIQRGMSRALYEAALHDIEGEPIRAIIAAALVRAEAVVCQPAELTKLNRARIKSRKPPFLDHEVIDLDYAIASTLRQVGHTKEEILAHLVSGHFKRRSSGVFWWRPHIRGAAT